MDIQSALNIAVPFTAKWETFSPVPYPDAGSYAIGYGNHQYSDGSTVEGTDSPISKSDAMDLLTYFETQEANTILYWLTVPLSNNQLAALIDLSYNAGSVYSSLQSLINSGADAQTVANVIAQTATTSQGVANTNLQARAAARAALYVEPDSLIPGIPNMALAGAGIILGLSLYYLIK